MSICEEFVKLEFVVETDLVGLLSSRPWVQTTACWVAVMGVPKVSIETPIRVMMRFLS